MAGKGLHGNQFDLESSCLRFLFRFNQNVATVTATFRSLYSQVNSLRVHLTVLQKDSE